MKQEIIRIIEQTLDDNDAQVYVFDPDGEHFEALVVSHKFENLSLVAQHKMIMKPLKNAFETSVHALGLKTFSPKKWERQKHLYNIN